MNVELCEKCGAFMQYKVIRYAGSYTPIYVCPNCKNSHSTSGQYSNGTERLEMSIGTRTRKG